MNNFIDNTSSKIAFRLSESKDKSSDEYEVLKYGVFAFLHICIDILLTVIFGIITNTLFPILVISLMSAIMKRNSGGVHCSSPNRCVITGIIIGYIFTLLAKALTGIDQNLCYFIVAIILIHSFFVINKRCPVPSPNKPLKKEETRKRLRKNSFKVYFICVVLFLMAILLNSDNNFNFLVLCIILGVYMQVWVLTPLGNNFILLLDKILLKLKI